ncbi:hypothetical protein LTR37_000167 [Vermiconidia calcicola]|uniref:Uncharacterized protein n=1 Tax=Vermiconidia calcicola TaxID=1690605 RepID=A0ACC3NZQ0_9PEZI|nr:hypothetical protein LTR37_000167 [Vermiconidia calcicola]
MTTSFPSTHYACPCSDLTSAPTPPSSKRASIQQTSLQLNEEQAFNPHSPRANYTLYPIDHLLFCDECDEIRCPRCWTEEILYWYCPHCLFEVPSSAVKGDGNRCSRSCYDCPSCTSPLAVTQVSQRDEALLRPSDATGGDETYVLQCHYCDWSTLEIKVQFNKPTKITEQLVKQRKSRTSASKEKESSAKAAISHDDAFANLTTFYKDQLNETGEPQNAYPGSPYSSPANLARIMNIYGGLSHNALKKTRDKPQPMREAKGHAEGQTSFSGIDSDTGVIQRLQSSGWDATTTSEQRLSAPVNNEARFTDDLWPSATRLRTRRAKRCKSCRHIIARQEPKVGSMRYKIRLLAMNYIPRLSIRPLNPTVPITNPAFHLRPDMPEQEKLQPHQTKQYILTIRNPLFETVKITLATPATTPGNIASRVTILCPSFTVGPAGEVWDEALSASTQSASSDGGRKAAMASLTGSSESSDRQPEAGKIWEKTRNSTSVIVEIIPGSLKPPPSIVPKSEEELADAELEEDEDVLEVPVYVLAEWETEVKPGESVQGRKEVGGMAGEKVRKEVGYWIALGVGRIAG